MSGVRFKIEPRLIPVTLVARRLGISLGEFEKKLPALLADGFPAAIPILGTYHLEMVDRWIDARHLNQPIKAGVVAHRSEPEKRRAEDLIATQAQAGRSDDWLSQAEDRYKKWEEHVRSSPMIKRELQLLEFFRSHPDEAVATSSVTGASTKTILRFEVRGLVEVDGELMRLTEGRELLQGSDDLPRDLRHAGARHSPRD